MTEMRPYIQDGGDTIMLPVTDERVMTLEELLAKYDRPIVKRPTAICPCCGTYCYGDGRAQVGGKKGG